MTLFKKIWALLSLRQRRETVILLGLMIISMILETMWISLIVPILTLVTQGDVLARFPMKGYSFGIMSNLSHEHLIALVVLFLVGIYIIKVIFMLFLVWFQAKFSYGVQSTLSQRLFVGYLQQPYTFHLQRNSAQLIRNIVNETSMFTVLALNAGMAIMTDFLVLLGICLVLLYIEPVGAICVLVILGMAGIIFSSATRSRVLHWGNSRQLHDGFRLQHLQQGLGGVKEVKLLGREEEFLTQYSTHNVGSALMARRQNIMQALPRLWLELLAVVALAILVLALVLQGKPAASLVPTLGLFAAAAFRILPSINRILSSMQNLRYSLPVINILYSEVNQFDEFPTVSMQRLPLAFSYQLALCDVHYSYPDAISAALVNVNLVINKGASVGFIGESGAGKSTLIDLILGLLTPSTGKIKVDGIDIQSNLRGWQDQIGYVPQSIFLSDDTLRRNIAFGLANEKIDEKAVYRAVQAAQLDKFVATLPKGLDTLVGERGIRLSGGQRQRIGIARALYHNPAVLVLDEATSALDTETEQSVMDSVYALKGEQTLIIIAHRLSTVEGCDRLIRLDQGKIVEENTTVIREENV